MEVPSRVSLTDIRDAIRQLEPGQSQVDYRLSLSEQLPISEQLPETFCALARDTIWLLNSDNSWTLTDFEGILTGATKTEPGKLATTFTFLPHSPLRTEVVEGVARVADFSQAFAFRYRKIVEVTGQTARIHPEKIGKVYPFEQALRPVSTPFYLSSTEARVKPTLDGTLGVAVDVTMVDLADFSRLQINKFRRVQRSLERVFPS